MCQGGHTHMRALSSRHTKPPGAARSPDIVQLGAYVCQQEMEGRRGFKRVMANQSQSSTHTFTIHPSSACSLQDARSVPAVVLDHVGELDNELALLVLLTALKGMFLGAGGERETILTAGLSWM